MARLFSTDPQCYSDTDTLVNNSISMPQTASPIPDKILDLKLDLYEQLLREQEFEIELPTMRLKVNTAKLSRPPQVNKSYLGFYDLDQDLGVGQWEGALGDAAIQYKARIAFQEKVVKKARSKCYLHFKSLRKDSLFPKLYGTAEGKKQPSDKEIEALMCVSKEAEVIFFNEEKQKLESIVHLYDRILNALNSAKQNWRVIQSLNANERIDSK